MADKMGGQKPMDPMKAMGGLNVLAPDTEGTNYCKGSIGYSTQGVQKSTQAVSEKSASAAKSGIMTQGAKGRKG